MLLNVSYNNFDTIVRFFGSLLPLSDPRCTPASYSAIPEFMEPCKHLGDSGSHICDRFSSMDPEFGSDFAIGFTDELFDPRPRKPACGSLINAMMSKERSKSCPCSPRNGEGKSRQGKVFCQIIVQELVHVRGSKILWSRCVSVLFGPTQSFHPPRASLVPRVPPALRDFWHRDLGLTDIQTPTGNAIP